MQDNERGPSDEELSHELRKKLECVLTGVPEERQPELLENLLETRVPFYVV
ncbi:MAG TPA: hypothetical protein VJJ20_00245 [Candidatus Paceibacterota bacterium]